jgi:hypothetical protein
MTDLQVECSYRHVENTEEEEVEVEEEEEEEEVEEEEVQHRSWAILNSPPALFPLCIISTLARMRGNVMLVAMAFETNPGRRVIENKHSSDIEA